MTAELKTLPDRSQRSAPSAIAREHVRPPQREAMPVNLMGLALMLNSASIATLILGGATVSLHVTSQSAPWWSYLPTSLSAVGTVAAFTVTYKLFHRGNMDRIRSQAEQVFVKESRVTRSDGDTDVIATVFNESSGPIWRVEVKPLRSGKTYSDGLLQRYEDLWPSSELKFKWLVSKEHIAHEDRHPQLLFRDAGQRQWRRVGPKLEPVREGSRLRRLLQSTSTTRL
jgi:hypothetical protein